jgi:hypothetical protein
VRHLDRRRLDAVDHPERRHQFAGRMRRDLELAASHVADLLGEHLAGAVDGVERLDELDARRQRMLACAWTIAGAAPAARTPAMPVLWMNERRCIRVSIRCGNSERAAF